LKILVIDDHPLIREALRHVLKSVDDAIELTEAQNLPEALAAATKHPDIALILLDLTLPGVEGLDALTELREQHPAIPVVVLSASDQAETVRQALDRGAMGFVPKTSSNQVLVGALRLVLSGGVYLPPEVLRADTSTPPAGSARGASDALRSPRDIGLTERQSEVLALLIQGKPNKLICRQLNLAEGTVKIHVTAILKTLGVTNRTQAVIAVSKLGLRLPSL
jgi:DNA-binding NarL/FixJ family response regulator